MGGAVSVGNTTIAAGDTKERGAGQLADIDGILHDGEGGGFAGAFGHLGCSGLGGGTVRRVYSTYRRNKHSQLKLLPIRQLFILTINHDCLQSTFSVECVR
jgi:hypothetical protein